MRSCAPWVLALVPGLATARAVAADDVRVVPCRPTVTCTADLAAPGTLEIEVGYQVRRVSGELDHGTPVLVKLPVAPVLELQLGTNGYTRTDTASYVDNVVAGAKLHLADQTARRPSFAVTASISVPTPAQRGYARVYDAAIVGHASKDLGSFHVDLNAALVVDQLGGPRAYQPWAALAATYAATSRVSLALEPHYFADAAPLAARDAGVIAAVELAARSWLVIDGAIDAVASEPRSLTAIIGVSIAPARLWGETR